jgi:hypothetical protein
VIRESAARPVRDASWQTRAPSLAGALREPRIGLDLADLEDVPLFVRGNQQRPLIGVALLPADDVSPKIGGRAPDVLEQSRMVPAVGLKACRQIAQLSSGTF